MAINPFSTPAGGSGQGGANLVPKSPEQPALPVEQLAKAASQFQKRRNTAKNELGQAMTQLAESSTLGHNRGAFQKMTRPIQQRLSEIAESNEFINKEEEIRKLTNQITQKQKVFSQNKKSYETSIENLNAKLEEGEISRRQFRTQKKSLLAESNIELGENGQPVEGQTGMSTPKQYGPTKTPYDIVDDLDFGKMVAETKKQMPDGEVRRLQKKGVFKGRVRREALRRMGMGKNAPMDPEFANWMEMESQAIRANNPNLSPKEVEARIRSQMEVAVKSAQQQHLTEGKTTSTTVFDPSSGGSSGDGEDSTYTYPGRTRGVNISEMGQLDISRAQKEEFRAVSQIRQEKILERARQDHGIGRDFYKKVKQKEAELGREGAYQWVKNNRADGESAWTSYQTLDDEMQTAQKVSVNEQFIGVDEAEEANELERRVFGAMPSAEKLVIPGAQGSTWTGLTGTSAKQERQKLMKNAKLVGLGSEAGMIQMRYTGDKGTEHFAPHDKFMVRMPQEIRDALLNDNGADILGERVHNILKKNHNMRKVPVTDEWTGLNPEEDSSSGNEIQMRISLSRDQGRSGAKSASTEYEVKAGNTKGTYETVLKAIEDSDDDRKVKQTYVNKLRELADRDPSIDQNVIATAARTGVENMPSKLREELRGVPIALKNKGVAAEWGRRIQRINNNR